MKQFITPDRKIMYAGDCVTFRLEGTPAGAEAFVRTTLGYAHTVRCEIIEHTENGSLRDGMAWHDRPMKAVEGGFELTLPLLEPGIFEAKCCCRVRGELCWPDGGNFYLKVEPAADVAGSCIYCAFVRQFGAGKVSENAETLARMDHDGYTVIPPSGTFRDVIRKLDHIFDDLHCRIIQLLPVHPTPTVYGRMGRYGSPFASTDYFAVDPELAEFDPKATPMEQFQELVDAVHGKSGRIFLDIPVNHTGWASRLQNEHPEYFVRKEDGTFESPGAWGVVWADLCKLDYENPAVHRLMAEVFLHWCRHGVDGFRCDAGYMLPAEAWEYITAKVREEYPSTVFLLEGLGGRISVQESLLSESGLDWAYSELFQNYDRDAVSRYFPEMDRCSREKGILVNFAETHDNLRLAATSPEFAAMRCALCAFLSENGAFGFANGVENLAREKIDVHGAGSLNWGASPNLIGLLARLNLLLMEHPAFSAGAKIENVTAGGGNGVAFLRTGPEGKPVLALVNLDHQHALKLHWRSEAYPAVPAWDLAGDRMVSPQKDSAGPFVELPPGGFCCLGSSRFVPEGNREPSRVTRQRLKLAALRVMDFFGGTCHGDPAEALRLDPWKFVTEVSGLPMPPMAEYEIGRDERRLVPMAPGTWLLAVCSEPFRVRLYVDGFTVRREESIQSADGRYFALIAPAEEVPECQKTVVVQVVRHPAHGPSKRSRGELLLLPKSSDARFRMRFPGREAIGNQLAMFGANHHGGYTMTRAAFSRVYSKYDALLAVNGDSAHPTDRFVLLSRIRAWLSVDGYSYAIDERVLADFTAGMNCGAWNFRIPSGQGRVTLLAVELLVSREGEGIEFRFTRALPRPEAAPEVRIILRPDVECRVNHEVTLAYAGPEKSFPAAVRPAKDGFTFAPDPVHPLTLEVPGGRFVSQPEWKYMEHFEMEARYGLKAETDLFSPGYLEFTLRCGESKILRAWSGSCPEDLDRQAPLVAERDPMQAAGASLSAYTAARDGLSTVIAGYPWFLDWGRDTLIALRGLIASGHRDEAADILCQFAGFEENGTIPNIIHGSEVGNRDTCDAPLWMGVAARDFVEKFGDALLKRDCRGRAFGEILRNIVRCYRGGTPNGIRVDPESLLVFSPAHFTWMDTNFPAGTPREGYPIEIQALWQAMLDFAGDRDGAQQVREAIESRFYLPGLNRFSDCLHGRGSAVSAIADDHVRPNQLLAVTLGAITRLERKIAVIRSAQELLTPGAIRSLSDRQVSYLLPVSFHGQLLNNPKNPYIGHYRGPEDTSRKAAYHNGTAWGWLYPSYCEALYMADGDRESALALLYAGSYRADRGIPGQIAEIADGDAPHAEQGCSAQAWSMTEFYRVARLLSD